MVGKSSHLKKDKETTGVGREIIPPEPEHTPKNPQGLKEGDVVTYWGGNPWEKNKEVEEK